MVMGVGGSSFAAELDQMTPMTGGVQPIGVAEYQARIAKAQTLMRAQGIDALYLDTPTNLRYFTGIPLTLTERLHGAVIPAQGEIAYLSPTFEGTENPHPACASARTYAAGRSTRTRRRW